MKFNHSLVLAGLVSTGFLTSMNANAATRWIVVGPDALEANVRGGYLGSATSNGVYIESSSGAIVSGGYFVPLQLPIGAKIRSMYCQVYDNGSASKVTVTLQEVKTFDQRGHFGADVTDMLATGTSNAYKGGHVIVASNAIIGTDTVQLFVADAIYSYRLYVSQNGSAAVKTCAISYTPEA